MPYTVAVRTLCEFTAKQGDLDLRFTPSPSAQEGMEGHALVRTRRSPDYRCEISLTADYGGEEGLRVRGRADGYEPSRNRLEEIKTHRGSAALIPDNHRQLHMAQLKIYGWLMCQQQELREITLALVYFDIVSQTETVQSALWPVDDLQAFFEDQCACFLGWARAEMAHRERRDAAMRRLVFPHAAFRAGQRELAEAVYRSASSGRCLMAQAPTGIGKTMATVFPMLKAMPVKQIDKIFFLAAKTSGRTLALGALSMLRDVPPSPPLADSAMPAQAGVAQLRVLELVARDKACEYPERACHGESCPLARGFYDKLPAARSAALDAGWLERDKLRDVALAHEVCPYYLSQDLARWSDVLIGDYNYYFDLNAMLYGLTRQNQWSVGLLVDEAHNLVERGRKMVSAELHYGQFRQQRARAPAQLRSAFERLARRWSELRKLPAHTQAGSATSAGSAAGTESAAADKERAAYQVLPAVPEKFLQALQLLGTDIMDAMNAEPLAMDAGLLDFYFDVLHFCRVAELVSSSENGTEHTLVDLTRSPVMRNGKQERQALLQQNNRGSRGHQEALTICLRNIVPAYLLAPRFRQAHSATLFSATFTPTQFYHDMLGLPDDAVSLSVASPFRAEQLSVRLAAGISTRFQHRDASAIPIARLIARQFAERPGNYLAFFSSFDYLSKVVAALRQENPDIPLWEQARRMDEAARGQFLSRFAEGGQGVGFAVLGGVFSEGVDLPGERLIGAFIATLGLPQWNPVNEQMRQRMQALYGAGHDYVYLYPGMQKVVQAAGRVIRSEQDQGVVILIDDRFTHRQVRELLPEWWTVQTV